MISLYSVLCSASAAPTGNKPLLTQVSTNATIFPLFLSAGWNLDMMKSFLELGVCPLLTRSKARHKVHSSPTSCGFVKHKSCQTNLIFLCQGSRSQRGRSWRCEYVLTALRLLTLFHMARWGYMAEKKCSKVPNQLGKHTQELSAVYCRIGRMA